MEGDFAACDATAVALGKHTLGEVQAGCGCCHAALYVRIYRLVVLGVARLSAAVKVGRNGNLSHRVENGSKSHPVAPLKFHLKGIAAAAGAPGREPHRAALHRHLLHEFLGLPSLGVAYKAQP